MPEVQSERLGPWFQVRVNPTGQREVFLLDLELEDLIGDLLLPMYSGGTVFLRGRETPVSKLFAVQIVATQESLRPELKAWFAESSFHSTSEPVAEFMRKKRIFDLETDVTGKLTRAFRTSSEWKEVRELLAEREALLQDRASRLAQGEEDEGTPPRLAAVVDRIAYLSGIFVNGFLTGG